MGHSFPYEDDKKPVEYKDTTGKEFYDDDIKDTHAHLNTAEQTLGNWKWNDKRDDHLINWMNPQNIQLAAEKGGKGKSRNKATRESEHKDWPKHRYHFKNNYKNFP